MITGTDSVIQREGSSNLQIKFGFSFDEWVQLPPFPQKNKKYNTYDKKIRKKIYR